MEQINFDFEVLVAMETSTVVYVLVAAYGTDRRTDRQSAKIGE